MICGVCTVCSLTSPSKIARCVGTLSMSSAGPVDGGKAMITDSKEAQVHDAAPLSIDFQSFAEL
eukprot:6464055-Amphidinium_carterae.1